MSAVSKKSKARELAEPALFPLALFFLFILWVLTRDDKKKKDA